MDGKMIVTYKILCKNDFNLELTLQKLLENEKVSKVIKSEFAKGIRNIDIFSKELDSKIKIETQKELYQLEVDKNDFADLITLAEEDAKTRKLTKKDCVEIELVNIETID
ncbi:hypothetical protein [Halarcobacter sp.]|uniref:hypothetical protein n=1 Tax=Halarcobacter sp. TaxID=2321133 RepID=UPI0029F5723D|nr:hypothetical protein [Halarcobacter sp.]